jgi:hypothetical protein
MMLLLLQLLQPWVRTSAGATTAAAVVVFVSKPPRRRQWLQVVHARDSVPVLHPREVRHNLRVAAERMTAPAATVRPRPAAVLLERLNRAPSMNSCRGTGCGKFSSAAGASARHRVNDDSVSPTAAAAAGIGTTPVTFTPPSRRAGSGSAGVAAPDNAKLTWHALVGIPVKVQAARQHGVPAPAQHHALWKRENHRNMCPPFASNDAGQRIPRSHIVGKFQFAKKTCDER